MVSNAAPQRAAFRFPQQEKVPKILRCDALENKSKNSLLRGASREGGGTHKKLTEYAKDLQNAA
ncbi:hypothetical protein [Candidatus Electronema sp. PJ]|uniref:hypothetical protein n=1 Tax=Candidatus Electronema sp. PJ TaxID=3401572 RepID=UPI003AA8D904